MRFGLLPGFRHPNRSRPGPVYLRENGRQTQKLFTIRYAVPVPKTGSLGCFRLLDRNNLYTLTTNIRMLLAFHKPFGIISQFSPDGSPNRTLADFRFPKDVYAIGRLDADSEGLLLLSDEPALNQKLLHPRHAHARIYWAQVENVPDTASLWQLERGITIQGRRTLPCRAWLLDPQPDISPRTPPIRFRKNIPTAWIALELVEGKNRQVRRMTASIGHPTLRLLRIQIGQFELGGIAPGKWKALSPDERAAALKT